MDVFAVVLPAAGSSTRFGTNKLAEVLGGKTVIGRSVEAFLKREDVGQIVIPTQNAEQIQDLIRVRDERILFCSGGATRADSVRCGVEKVRKEIAWVAVHDAARPLVSQELISATFEAAKKYGAAVPAMAVHLTIKQARGPLPAKVERTLPRAELWAMQTPQAMRRDDLLEAYAKCKLPMEQVTDDVQLLELCGKTVYLIAGEERNIKITTRGDISLAQQWISSAEC